MTSPGPTSRAERNARLLATPTANLAEQDARRVWRESGSDDPRVSVAEIARQLGHTGGRVERTVSGQRWFAFCSCGFVTTSRLTESDALGGLTHHIRLALRAWRNTGLPLAAAQPAPPADWERVRRRHRHFAAWENAQKGAEKGPRGVSETDTPRHAVG